MQFLICGSQKENSPFLFCKAVAVLCCLPSPLLLHVMLQFLWVMIPQVSVNPGIQHLKLHLIPPFTLYRSLSSCSCSAFQDVFTRIVFVFANCEPVSGLPCQHDALITVLLLMICSFTLVINFYPQPFFWCHNFIISCEKGVPMAAGTLELLADNLMRERVPMAAGTGASDR